jgi:hypothetical protein
MVRFKVNREWAFILTLCLFTTCFFLLGAQSPSPAHAVHSLGEKALTMGDGSTLSGDPDVPVGPGDGAPSTVGSSSVSRVVSQTGASSLGEGAAPTSVLMRSLRIVLLSLRHCLLRF